MTSRPWWCRAFLFVLVATSTFLTMAIGCSAADDPATQSPSSSKPIDFDEARRLLKKQQSGSKLTSDEEAYLNRAKAARKKGNDSSGRNSGSTTPRDTVGFKPINEMTAEDQYKNQEGGLYGQGLNTPPSDHRIAAEKELAKIVPLDENGQASENGLIGFVSISMSNATMEFSRFKKIADVDPAKSSKVTIVDCAQGGQAMAEWTSPNAPAWKEADRRLQAARVSPKQIQTAWIKIANKGPQGELDEHGKQLQKDTQAVIQNAKQRFPNLRIIYLSSRIFGGQATSALNPEPYAYESGFVVRWLIEDQIRGHEALNFDADKGTVSAPLLLWGPYLWADGTTPRIADKLFYTREDFAADGTHPSDLGRDKVAKTMLDFFKSDSLSKSWFSR